jgi:phosphatidylglycerol:prolipoprotein diacylglycerol transferase
MYGMALALSAATTAGTVGIPFFQLGSIGPIQSFGIIVAAGVLIGAALLRRYAEWHGVSDDHIRGLTGWITVTGFLGAHIFDVLAYQWHDFMRDPVLLIKVWSGISSYGGFIGGAIGFFFYVWWKRLPPRLMADIAIVGLLPAFSIGRIGCSVVSDHIGAVIENHDAWYSIFGMEYPHDLNMEAIHYLIAHNPEHTKGATILAWNLGFVEFAYLVPVNLLILFLAFRSKKRVPAGFVTVLTGVLYAPVRFFLDYLRPPNSDPRHFGFTFAQWASILAFGGAMYFAFRVFRGGKPAETVTKTSGEAQERLRMILKEDVEESKQPKAKKPAAIPKAVATEKPAAEKEPEMKTAAERKADLIAAIKRDPKKESTSAVKATEVAAAAADAKPETPVVEKDDVADAKVEGAKAADAKAVAKPDDASEAATKPGKKGPKKSKK